LPVLEAVGLPAVELTLSEAGRRWPQVEFAGVKSVFFEAAAGYLLARRACQEVARAVAAQGGEVRTAAVRPGPLREGRMTGLSLSDGTVREADAYVFACGPWLGRLFPAEVGERILPTRQEVFFFGPPEGDSRFEAGALPVWMDMSGERVYYGIPGVESRGFKIADDSRGAPIDPSEAERAITPDRLAEAREHLARRFPALAGAPLVESRVCQYENTPDGQLLVDRHPAAGNAWLVGGGSGHGFKLAPALGEHVAGLVLEGAPTLPQLQLAHRVPVETPRSQFLAQGR
jgi:glycine/D-amino acid oxidase-like deaminating enzyme